MKRTDSQRLADRIALSVWLRTGASLASVEASQPVGILGNCRHTAQAVRAFRLIWSWSAPRMSGAAGAAQDRLYRISPALLDSRIERAARMAWRLACYPGIVPAWYRRNGALYREEGEAYLDGDQMLWRPGRGYDWRKVKASEVTPTAQTATYASTAVLAHLD